MHKTILGRREERVVTTRACPSVTWALATTLLLASCSGKSTNVTALNDTELRENATWSGTVRLSGEVVVPEGVTLTVKAGTEIAVVEPWDARIVVNGRLYVKGRKRRPVRVHGGEKGLAWGGYPSSASTPRAPSSTATSRAEAMSPFPATPLRRPSAATVSTTAHTLPAWSA
jgi:hypothetical protein